MHRLRRIMGTTDETLNLLATAVFRLKTSRTKDYFLRSVLSTSICSTLSDTWIRRSHSKKIIMDVHSYSCVRVTEWKRECFPDFFARVYRTQRIAGIQEVNRVETRRSDSFVYSPSPSEKQMWCNLILWWWWLHTDDERAEEKKRERFHCLHSLS